MVLMSLFWVKLDCQVFWTRGWHHSSSMETYCYHPWNSSKVMWIRKYHQRSNQARHACMLFYMYLSSVCTGSLNEQQWTEGISMTGFRGTLINLASLTVLWWVAEQLMSVVSSMTSKSIKASHCQVFQKVTYVKHHYAQLDNRAIWH